MRINSPGRHHTLLYTNPSIMNGLLLLELLVHRLISGHEFESNGAREEELGWDNECGNNINTVLL